MLRFIVLVTLTLTSLLGSATGRAEAQQHARRASPFDELRWVADEPEVRVGSTWYRAVSIQGVRVEDILRKCDQRWPGQRQKRFGEDLVEAMDLLGHVVPASVRLELVRLDDERPVTLEAVAMTEAKRNSIRDAANALLPAPLGRPQGPVSRSSIPRAEAEQDIDVFRARLTDQFSYLELRGVDLERELERVRASLTEEVAVGELAGALREVLMLFGDGHARVRSEHDPRGGRYLPFVLDVAAGGVVASLPDRSAWLDPSRPYVQALDGRPLAAWLAALRPTLPAGSPQFVRRLGLWRIQDVEVGRARLGLPSGDAVYVALSTRPAGGDVRRMELRLVARRMRVPVWPPGSSRHITGEEALGITGGVGYLRLPAMEDERIASLHQWMKRFRDTGALIVDVRGNTGGERGLLLALGGYLVGERAPLVANVAAYRASERFERDHLGGSRHLYRADDPYWSEEQRAAIETFAAGFEPEWSLPAGFSEWHYLLLDRTGQPEEYDYTQPVVVLCDAHCFSATDIFLGALELLPQVTLVGAASGGGSARSRSFELPSSGIEVTCGSMASFRPDGRLYDGRGVEVDVEVERAPGDLLPGGGDAQLEAALEWLAR